MMSVKSLVVFGLGFVSGWAARSLADSPHDAGVKLMAIAMSTRERVGRWVAVERERVADMLAEARWRVEPEGSASSSRSDEERATQTNGVAHPTEEARGAA